MNEFVECRREWRRLGVPEPVAAEMAADLAADLDEAAAEGAAAEDVLGSSAFDPRSFAASWAAECGVIRAAPSPVGGRRRPGLLVAIAAFAAVAVVGLVLVVASPSGSVRVAVAPAALRVAVLPPPRILRLPGVGVRPRLRVVAPRIAAVELGRSRRRLWWIGLAALVVGVSGLVASTAAWLRTR